MNIYPTRSPITPILKYTSIDVYACVYIYIYIYIYIYNTASTDISTGERDFYMGTGLATFDFKIGFPRGWRTTPTTRLVMNYMTRRVLHHAASRTEHMVSVACSRCAGNCHDGPDSAWRDRLSATELDTPATCWMKSGV